MLMLIAAFVGLAAAIAQPEVKPAPQAKPAEPTGDRDLVRDRLMADLRSIPAKRAALGDAEHREGLVKAEAWLKDRFREIGVEPVTHEFVWESVALKAAVVGKDDPAPATDDPRFKFRNYILEFPGTDLASEVLLIGAHYDAVPKSPGADDNASGTVALLEVARSLKGTKHRRTVRLAFFTLEEVGLVGSARYLKDNLGLWVSTPPEKEGGEATKPKETFIGMVSLECIGYFSDTPDSQVSPVPKLLGKPVINLKVPSEGNFIGIGGIAKHRAFSQKFAEEMGRGVPELPILAADMLPIAPPDFLRSDHAPFLLAGLPAVILTDTANFRNPHYHRPTDTPDTIDPVRLARVTRAVSAATSAMAERILKDPHE